MATTTMAMEKIKDEKCELCPAGPMFLECWQFWVVSDAFFATQLMRIIKKRAKINVALFSAQDSRHVAISNSIFSFKLPQRACPCFMATGPPKTCPHKIVPLQCHHVTIAIETYSFLVWPSRMP